MWGEMYKKYRLIYFCEVLIMLVLLQSYALAQNSCTTKKCHSSLVSGTYVHPVATECETCHEATSSKHPQKGKETFKLTQSPPQLCYMCHEAFGTKENISSIHPPVKEGMCTFCHDPHSSQNQYMIKQKLPDLCFNCHDNNISDKVVHGPSGVGSCTICHNPHESRYEKLKIFDEPDLCFQCHTEIKDDLKKGHVHPAIEMGCTACHNPHSGPYAKMLPASGKDLCFKCHSDIKETLDNAKSIHPPIMTERACLSCHSPHANRTEILTDKKGNDLCLECHSDILPSDAKFIHKPIRTKGCTACHSPHGTKNIKLLKKYFPPSYYTPYSDKKYELCFSCHGKEFLMYPDTSYATNFRDGNRNLHYLHVHRKKKGRTCRFCHTPHTSTNDRLIRTGIKFGRWFLPINFKKTPNGGTCTPGCHKKVIYDRKEPGQKVKLPKQLPK